MSAVVEQSSVISKELDYKMMKYSHPTYNLTRILPLSGTQDVAIQNGSGNQERLFELPTKVFNPSESIFQWDTTIPDLNTKYNIAFADTIGELNQIELYTRSGQFLARIEDVNTYIQCVLPKETALSEFLSFEDSDVIKPCNLASADNKLPTSSLGGVNTASRAFVEKRYLVAGAVGNAGTQGDLILRRRFKLGSFLNSFFSINKDVLFPEVLILRVLFNGSKLGFTADDAAGTTPIALAGANVINNLQLLLAVEQNQEIINSLQQKITAGFDLMIPYIHRYKNNLTGSQQNVSIRLNRGHGAVCKKIIHSLYHATETVNNAYNHSNLPAAAFSVAAPITLRTEEYYTMLDNNRIQQYNLDCSFDKMDDYVLHKPMLKGSCLLDYKTYAYNWLHCEDFSNEKSPSFSDVTPVSKDNLVSGLDLTIERKWDWVGTSMRLTNNHYTFVICDKALKITPTLITVV
jgi:hypothetical protein